MRKQEALDKLLIEAEDKPNKVIDIAMESFEYHSQGLKVGLVRMFEGQINTKTYKDIEDISCNYGYLCALAYFGVAKK